MAVPRLMTRISYATAMLLLGGAAHAQTTAVGPGESASNSGTLSSNSRTEPVVTMTGDSSFSNSGTVSARSNRYVAISGDDGAQTVTSDGGDIRGSVTLGGGNDSFLFANGTLDGAFSSGAGDDTATIQGLDERTFGKATFLSGDATLGGNDTLVLDGSDVSTRRIIAGGFNNVTLINGATLKMNSTLELANGTLTIDPDSKLFAGNNVLQAIQASPGGSLTVVNAGGISLQNGGDVATDTLTIRGDYVGQNGYLALHTVLGPDGSASDRLIIDGGAVSGTTRVEIQNVGGLGALTTGDGIEVISAINGGTTTALTTGDGFVLDGGQVDAGAFEYRLFASNQAGTNESWYLRSQGSDQTGNPGDPDPDPPAYRQEVPLLAALPGSLAMGDLAFLGTLHRRVGDDFGTVADRFTVPGRIWGRAIYEDGKTRRGGDARPETDGRSYGFQVGVDLFEFGSPQGHHNAGLYGGYVDSRWDVAGFASGLENQSVGQLKPDTTYAGFYWTYMADSGFYFDTVVQHSWYGGDADVQNGNRATIDGTGVLGSFEVGYGFALTPNWTLEPQVQIVGQGLSLDDLTIPNATVSQRSKGQLTGRVGVRAKGRYDMESGSIQPYARANLWKGFKSTDETVFTGPAEGSVTVIETRNASLWGDAGAGLTWAFNNNMAIYGEVNHRFSLDDDQGVRGNSTGASVGVKLKL